MLASAIGPVIFFAVVAWVFVRAARRNDAEEALAKERGERPLDR